VYDPQDDRTFDNCMAFFNAMRGRDFTAANLAWCLQYLQGRGGRGERLRWLDCPSRRTNRGHIPTSEADFRFAPKSDSNHTPLSRHSHSNDPRFNGELDRRKMQRPAEPDLMASHKHVWMMQAKSLVGRTHSETQRVQKIVSQTPGGGRAAYEAGLREQRKIEMERARGK